jgi:23S rRNA-/tRNA-specific pseudouridylate synthase
MAPKWQSSVISSLYDGDLQAINVPSSGYYGLCFCMNSDCKCKFAAHEHGTSTQDGAILSLPEYEGKNVLSSLEIGTLVYLHKSTNLQVSCIERCDSHSAEIPTFEWCLFLQYKGTKEEYSTKKKIICAECCRMFSSLYSVQQHIGFAHTTIDPNSIWSKPLNIVYEDAIMLVVDKPQGMAVMGEKPSLFRSDLLLPLVGEGKDAMTKPVYVHRLDAPTGGLLVLARTKAAEVELKGCFATRLCRKRYLALALGRIEPKQGKIEEALSGKAAVTNYKVVEYIRCDDDMAKDGWLSLVDLFPVTGRNHQLRRHLKHIGHPIWGDKKYAPYRKRKAESDSEMNRADVINSIKVEDDPHGRLCLWATEISFPHPDTGIDLTVKLEKQPEWLTSLLAYQEKHTKQDEQSLRCD